MFNFDLNYILFVEYFQADVIVSISYIKKYIHYLGKVHVTKAIGRIVFSIGKAELLVSQWIMENVP